MRYFGGKSRIANDIVKILKQYRKDGQTFVEPFVGGANIVTKMDGKCLAFDKHKALIEMYKAIQNGWIPPDNISEDEYKLAKNLPDTDPLKAFIGFGCSFAGKYFGGYARCANGNNYAKTAKNSILNKFKNLNKDLIFQCQNYGDLILNNCLVYCDPPYHNTTKYTVGDFNSNEFWNIMREWSKNNTVIISEYVAPDDFEVIWSKSVTTDIRGNSGRLDRVEKLFKMK